MKVPFFIKVAISDRKENEKEKILEARNKIDELNRQLSFEKSCLNARERELETLERFEKELEE